MKDRPVDHAEPDRLWRLAWWLWKGTEPVGRIRCWLGNRVSDLRYYIWRARHGPL